MRGTLLTGKRNAVDDDIEIDNLKGISEMLLSSFLWLTLLEYQTYEQCGR